MPSVNAGPSNSASVNTQTPTVPSQAASSLAGLPVVTQAGASAGTLSAGLLVAQSGMAVGIAGTGTMGANGALTLGTALASFAHYASGCYLYFPAGAVYSGSLANFYFTKMTSTTAGVVTNNTYVATAGAPSVPTAIVPVVDAGPGAYTGVTTVQTVFQATVPANVMGNNGALQIEQFYTYTNSAGTKTFNTTWGGTTVLNAAPTTTVQVYQTRSLVNRGVTNSQISPPAAAFSQGAAGAGAIVSTTTDTTQSSTLITTLTLNTATDNAFNEFFRISAFYGA